MALVRIFHNNAVDEHGRHLAWIGSPPDFERGYQPEHPMVLVFAYTTTEKEAGDDYCEAGRAFFEFNMGEGPLAQDYNACKLRSLSTGDVVAVGDNLYACQSMGWKRLYRPLLMATGENRTMHGTRPLDGTEVTK